jgi:hypothetical protein
MYCPTSPLALFKDLSAFCQTTKTRLDPRFSVLNFPKFVANQDEKDRIRYEHDLPDKAFHFMSISAPIHDKQAPPQTSAA